MKNCPRHDSSENPRDPNVGALEQSNQMTNHSRRQRSIPHWPSVPCTYLKKVDSNSMSSHKLQTTETSFGFVRMAPASCHAYPSEEPHLGSHSFARSCAPGPLVCDPPRPQVPAAGGPARDLGRKHLSPGRW